MPKNVHYYFEMQKAFYGGNEEEALHKPLISVGAAPTSPLELDPFQTGCIFEGVKYNMPIMDMSMAMSGGTSPVHLAGTLVTHNAEILSSNVLVQCLNPGNPIWYGSATTVFDLKRGTAPVGSPEMALISACVANLAQYYELPSWVAGI
ncbi:MAG: hypothetical protein GXX95_11795 [Methanomassiliicoccus sp.]|nr:hypothetical protein [Methanomassiliicoccus sp.]